MEADMRKKVLVVEDEPDILRVVSYRLEKSGYEVITAVNGDEALEMAKKENPDLIFLDLRLPVTDGYEVCRELKSDEIFRSIPIILLTASSNRAISEEARDLKADDWLVKPFDPEDLLEKVDKFIG